MLGQFCLRLACGVAWTLALLPPTQVASGFFRSRLYLVLALAIVAVLAAPTEELAATAVRWTAAAAAVISFVGTAAWLLERRRVGRALLVLLGAVTTLGVLQSPDVSSSAGWADALLVMVAPLAGAWVLGSMLVAMLLGHAYLVAPAMSLALLRRVLGAVTAALALRGALAGVALLLFWSGAGFASASPLEGFHIGLLAARLVAGITGPLVLVGLTRQTVKIRSTQSATGILYAGVILAFLGELAAQVFARQTGIPV